MFLKRSLHRAYFPIVFYQAVVQFISNLIQNLLATSTEKS